MSVISVAISHAMLFTARAVPYCWENVQQMLVNISARVSLAACVCVRALLDFKCRTNPNNRVV